MSLLAWHFLPADRRLLHGSREGVQLGVPIEVAGPPVLGERGLHASARPLDAIHYAAGPIACRVELGGEIARDADKLVGTRRTVLAWCDATRLLHRFACDVAAAALDRVEKGGSLVDPRSRRAIEVKRAWLEGKATDEELISAGAAAGAAWATAAKDAAAAAAWAASWASARDAACDAARSAASAAACDAARSAASAAAWSATRNAAWDAASAAAWTASSAIAGDAATWAAAGDAAGDAACVSAFIAASAEAWDTAWAAARDAQDELLERALIEEMGIHEKLPAPVGKRSRGGRE